MARFLTNAAGAALAALVVYLAVYGAMHALQRDQGPIAVACMVAAAVFSAVFAAFVNDIRPRGR